MKYYFSVLKKYATFSGRASRQEYWTFVLINMVVGFIALAVDNLLGLTFGSWDRGLISIIYSFLVLLPGLGVTIRRLHDIGKSGVWIFISLIPIIGAIWLLVLMCTAGSSDENEYGMTP